MKLTAKQRELVSVCADPGVSHVLAYGGARSGKTMVDLDVILHRALKYPGSRHLAARLRFNHAKVSLWLDSLPRLLAWRGVDPGCYEANHSDYFLRFDNGSEIWVDGLDSAERIEKILGREYATVYLNEISQLSYEAALVARTRLSQTIKAPRGTPRMRCYALYDCNPPTTRHWAYQLWFLGRDPESGEPLRNPGAYRAVRLNPYDNEENLPEGYIQRELETLPEAKRRRFLLGEFTDGVAGLIFRRAAAEAQAPGEWDVVETIPERALRGRVAYGLDFGFAVDPSAGVLVAIQGDDLYIDELFYADGLTNDALAAAFRQAETPYLGPAGERLAFKVGHHKIWPDSAEPKSIAELKAKGLNVWPAEKGPDSVRHGLDWLLGKRLHVTRRSVNIQNELQEYRWAATREGRLLGAPIDEFNHAIDAIRYGSSEWMGALVPAARSIL